jgi:diphosphomevalonate decarboxylase
MSNQKIIPKGGLVSYWQSPSNIALIKYWGKRDRQLPQNASLSISLSNAITRTWVKLLPGQSNRSGLELDFKLSGERNPAFAERLSTFLESLTGTFPFLSGSLLEIQSENSFPHSAGIASSASAMSALALCLCDLEQKLEGENIYQDDFFRKASVIARMGSGSASRSVFGGYTVWGSHADVPASSDEFAVPLPFEPHEIYRHIKNTILIVDASAKKVSSSVGHHLMNGHPFAEARFKQAESNLALLLDAIKIGNWEEFSRITENEALSLHAMMMSSNPGYMLIHPNTLVVLDKMKHFREKNKVKLCFTLDAGPNIHLLYPENETEAVKPFLSDIQEFCVNHAMIDDQIGSGPINLEI